MHSEDSTLCLTFGALQNLRVIAVVVIAASQLVEDPAHFAGTYENHSKVIYKLQLNFSILKYVHTH